MHGGDIYSYGNVLDFSVNVNPLGMSEAVAEAAKRGVDLSAVYPDTGCRKLRAALSETHSLPGEWFFFGNGAADLFYTLVCAEKPKRALIPVPAFSEYEQALQTVGCVCDFAGTREEDGFTVDSGFEENLLPGMDMLFLCSPSNPSGRAADRALLLRIARRCERYGIRFVLDECFIEFLPEGEKQSLLREVGRYKSLIVVRAFTKIHAMAGLRLGYLASSDGELLCRMKRFRQPWNVSVPAQEAGLAALKEQGRVRQTRKLIAAQRKVLEERMKALGFRTVSSDANFILFRSRFELFHALLDRGILIRDCSDYRGLGPGWYRVAVRTEKENSRLTAALEEIAGGAEGQQKPEQVSEKNADRTGEGVQWQDQL